MTNEDLNKEQERLLHVFEQLPKEKQKQLLASEDLLCSWIKSNVKTTGKSSSSLVSRIYKSFTNMFSFSRTYYCLNDQFDHQATSDGFSIGPDEVEVLIAIAKYIKKKMGL